MNKLYQKVADIVKSAQKIVILQADNPDADSLGSALALEQILHELGKEPVLYCAVDIPGYLKYLTGWDRVSGELPAQFDASIIVDASTLTLFEKLEKAGQKGWLAAKPCIVLDHHEQVTNDISFASVTINDLEVSSTGELIYGLTKDLKWPLSTQAQEFLMTAILGDTQGLSNPQTRASTYRIIADMIDAGVDRAAMEEKRRELSKMTIDIFKYKARLLERTEFLADNQIAVVSVPNNEITQFSPQYNPKLLIQYEMLQTLGVLVGIVFKLYDNGRVTASIRSNTSAPIANQIAEHFDGGGHKYAAGFKLQDGRSFDDIKSETARVTTELLDKLEKQ